MDDVQLDLAEQAGISLDQIAVRLDYDYDSAGNRTEVVDRNDRKRTFEYDDRNRLIAELWWQIDVGSGLEEVIRSFTWQYCTCGSISQATEYDGPAGASPILSRYTYTYDTLGRMTSVDNAGTKDMPRVILSYGYDANGNRVRVQDNLGVAVVSEYDSRNRLQSRRWENVDPLVQAVDEIMVEFDYYRNGIEKELRRYDLDDTTGAKTLVGRTLNGNLDASGRVQNISHRNASDQILADYLYQFDRLGLVAGIDYINESPDYDFSVDYRYDDFGQLLDADYSDVTTGKGIYTDEFYRYDRNGNRTSSYLHGDGYVTGTSNRLLSDGTYHYEYDNEGNMIRKIELVDGQPTGAATVFDYDLRNRMTKATIYSKAPEEGGIILSESTNRYDVDGRRIAFSVDDDGAGPNTSQETRVTHNGDDTWADFNSLNEIDVRYMLGNRIDQMIAVWRSTESPSGNLNWHLTDHLATIRDVIDNRGIPINHILYEAFGNLAQSSILETTSRFLFAGRESHAVLSNYFYRSRQYDPTSGRFTSEDPTRFAANDINLYRYVNNSPLIATDPSGRISLIHIVLAVGTGITLANVYVAATTPVTKEFCSGLLGPSVPDFLPAALGFVLSIQCFTKYNLELTANAFG